LAPLNQFIHFLFFAHIQIPANQSEYWDMHPEELEAAMNRLDNFIPETVAAAPSPELFPGWEPVSPDYPYNDDDEDVHHYPTAGDHAPVSTLDLMCFEVDYEVFEETKKMVEDGIAVYGHMTENEIDSFIKSFFK
jgi:hypothetical protein